MIEIMNPTLNTVMILACLYTASLDAASTVYSSRIDGYLLPAY